MQGQVSVPEPLRPWQDWVLHGVKGRLNPPLFHDGSQRPGQWVSRLEVEANANGGRFRALVMVFEEEWVQIPGSVEAWPQEVRANGAAVPVLEREGRPVARLRPGLWGVEGRLAWAELPPRLMVPPEAGVLQLTVQGRAVPGATWDAQGRLLLQGARVGEAERDFLSKQVYRVIEDGIPMWLRTEVELTVSGKSREEELGMVMPEGWTLAQVTSALPVAVDGTGRLRAQVRAGRWTIRLDAFRLNDGKEFGYASGVRPMVSSELVAFRAKPDFRLVEIVGLAPVDVSQTTMPERWRDLPVYQWETARSFRLEERMRGMGAQRPPGLRVERQWWLDENGAGLTFRDQVSGEGQELWRLDAAKGQELGSVRMNGEGQLITKNPATGAVGIEVRVRNLEVEATGRAKVSGAMPASGWQADADRVRVQWELPPGWRALGIFGSDWVEGDWLTAWTLLDLFVLLVFTVAVGKLWGPLPGLLAFLAMGLSYHEPESPRYVWFFLLVPLALLRVVPKGWPQRVARMWKWVAVAALVLVAAPFVATQITAGLYPQLEDRGLVFPLPEPVWSSLREGALLENEAMGGEIPQAAGSISERRRMFDSAEAVPALRMGAAKRLEANLAQRAEARIQTGPGVPEWRWRTVSFGWNGPVTSEQEVRAVLVPAWLERLLSGLRVVLVVGLAGVLLGLSRTWLERWVLPAPGGVARVLVWLVVAGIWLGEGQVQAQAFPPREMLEELRQRLLQVPDVFPQAASISTAVIQLREDRLIVEAEVHAGAACAVPLPGRLPSWSPVSVQIIGRPEAALRRMDGFLWVAVPEGVSRVRVEGSVAGANEWECAFFLKPHRVTVDAPGWTVSGVKPTGEPERQIFLVRQRKAAEGEAIFDQRDYAAVVRVERELELGLVWKVRTVVRRLSAPGKAVSLRIPLLSGENVLTANTVVRDGLVEVRLGGQEAEVGWESELEQSETLQLKTGSGDSWVERWALRLSPVWNVKMEGLPPIFESGVAELVPVWQPWPGEGVSLGIGRPEAVEGPTLTVQRVRLNGELGKRQRVSELELGLQCSVGQDLAIGLPEEAEVSQVTVAGESFPVRLDGGRVVVPVRPGDSSVLVSWRENRELGLLVRGDRVTLPAESANVNLSLRVPEDRWVLWAGGPQQGPAVRFWAVLACAGVAAYILGGRSLSPLNGWEWLLLGLGLTQVNLLAAGVVVLWFFLVAWRGRGGWQGWSGWGFNLGQIGLVMLTLLMLGVVFGVVGAGLLGNPQMFIAGNDSTRTDLRWFAPQAGQVLPEPLVISVSVWWYRLLMLAWALWLAFALIRWLRWAAGQFTSQGWSRPWSRRESPPKLPESGASGP